MSKEKDIKEKATLILDDLLDLAYEALAAMEPKDIFTELMQGDFDKKEILTIVTFISDMFSNCVRENLITDKQILKYVNEWKKGHNSTCQ